MGSWLEDGREDGPDEYKLAVGCADLDNLGEQWPPCKGGGSRMFDIALMLSPLA